jgi:hypothetical protein
VADLLFKLTSGLVFPRINEIPMSRFLRHLLFASVLACHGLVTLCGPCLHSLPGSTHDLGTASKSHRPGDPSPSPRESSDQCLVCHFVAQGQMTSEYSCHFIIEGVAELVGPAPLESLPASHHVPSSPRAPPLDAPRLS